MNLYGDCGSMAEPMRATISVDIERWLARDVNQTVWWNIGRPVYNADRTEGAMTEFFIEIAGNHYEED